MSQVPEQVIMLDGESPFNQPEKRSANWVRVEGSLSRASEWLNPILVKEARQALKSRQFVVTFSLLLLFGWVWSLLGVALQSPGVYFAPGGRTMLTGYTIILMIPMLVIVPFSAFRSLAAEREDGTFELLSITTLGARQIVGGKLGSALLQMMVYYSALAPCIAFTYLLRGIDILTIVMLLFYAFLVSVLLSAFGLLVATLSRTRHWQVLLSVTLVIALVIADIIASYVACLLIWSAGSMAYGDFYFWMAQLAIWSFYATYLAVFVWGAAAQISFASDNRSTKLRVILLLQQVLWIGWMVYACLVSQDEELLMVAMVFASIHWFVAGSLMIGESGEMSPRVRRSLPQSFLGRMFRTWFNPGAGTGYMFAVLNVWSLAVVLMATAIGAEIHGIFGSSYLPELITFITITAAYVTIFLGIGRLLVMVLRRFMHTGLILPLLLQIAILAFAAIAPLIIEGWLKGFNDLDYTPIQITNWAWTMIEAGEGDLWTWAIVPMILYITAGCMLLLNMMFTIHEVETVRAQTPQRVVEDEQILHPERVAHTRRPKSPWDDEIEADSVAG
jgi:hypothetical protein